MNNKHSKYLILLFIIGLVLFLPDDSIAQCAMCRKNAESSLENGNSIAKGLNKGILYLMAIPYLALAFIFRAQLAGLYKKLRAKTLTNKG